MTESATLRSDGREVFKMLCVSVRRGEESHVSFGTIAGGCDGNEVLFVMQSQECRSNFCFSATSFSFSLA